MARLICLALLLALSARAEPADATRFAVSGLAVAAPDPASADGRFALHGALIVEHAAGAQRFELASAAATCAADGLFADGFE